ncbi:MAG: hypothetical protein JNM55_02565 [Anaerolineales bacterium]|nr:hypothetical protein [Anaerolineales bacterium]
MFDLDEIIKYFEDSNADMIRENIGLFDAEVSERTLCGALSQHLLLNISKTPFKEYYVDVEYNRNEGEIKTIVDDDLIVIPINCDLIVHSRAKIIEKDNLIALEMKKSIRPPKEKAENRKRLKILTREDYKNMQVLDGKTLPEHVCGYSLGIYYEVDFQKRKIYLEYYELGEKINEKVIGF